MTSVFIDALAEVWLALAVHLWQSSLVLLPLFLMSPWLRSAPARLIQVFWGAAVLKLLLPLSVCGRILETILPAGWIQGAGAKAEATLMMLGPVLDPRSRLVDATPAHELPGALLVLFLTMLWTVGALWGLLRLTRDLNNERREHHYPVNELSHEHRSKLDRALSGTTLSCEQIRISQARALPSVSGLFRPRILLPVRVLEDLDPAELRSVLLHEDGHRRRRDPLRAILLRLGATVLFFYPPVWALIRRFRQAAEFACDEGVLAGGVSAGTYARALARTVDVCLFPAPLAASSSLGGDSLLRRRLDRLTHSGRLRLMRKHRIVLFLAALLLALGTFLPLHSIAGDRTVEFDVPPKLLKSVPPEYPDELRKAGIGGTVVMELEIDPEGLVVQGRPLEEVEGHPEFTKAVVEVLPQWRFEPGKKDGKPVHSRVSIPIQFRTDDDDEADGEKKSGAKLEKK